MKRTYTVVLVGMLISMEVVLTRFLAIELPNNRITFGFLPMSIAAAIFGPVAGGGMYALSDWVGTMIAPRGSFFPGFTITAFLTGLTYGLVLYKKPKSIVRALIATFIIALFLHTGLNTFWAWVLAKGWLPSQYFDLIRHWGEYSHEYLAFIQPRAIKSAVMLPIQAGLIYLVWRFLGRFIEVSVLPKIGFRNNSA